MQGPNDDSELGSHGWRQDVVLRERVSVGRQRPGEGEARPYGYRRPRAVGEEGPYVRIEDIIVRMTTQHEMLEERDHRIVELEEMLRVAQVHLRASRERVRILEETIDRFITTIDIGGGASGLETEES